MILPRAHAELQLRFAKKSCILLGWASAATPWLMIPARPTLISTWCATPLPPKAPEACQAEAAELRELLAGASWLSFQESLFWIVGGQSKNEVNLHNMYLYIYICTHTHIQMHLVCMCMRIYIYRKIHIHILYTHIHVYVFMYICRYVLTYVFVDTQEDL